MQPDRCRKALFFPNMCSVNSGRLMKAQTLGDTSSLEFMRGRRIFEINPDHPIIKDLNVRFMYTPYYLLKFHVSSMFFCHAPIPLSVSCIRQTVTGCLQKRA